jgi:hypothetical protein
MKISMAQEAINKNYLFDKQAKHWKIAFYGSNIRKIGKSEENY